MNTPFNKELSRAEFQWKMLRLKRKLRYYAYGWFLNLLARIARSCQAAKQAWGSGDWDYSYALGALRMKLQRMYKHLTSEDSWAVHNRKDLKKLKIVIELLKRFEEGEGRLDHDLKSDPYYDLLRRGFKFERTPGDKPLTLSEEKFIRFRHKRNSHANEHNWSYLWDVVKKHGRKWWD